MPDGGPLPARKPPGGPCPERCPDLRRSPARGPPVAPAGPSRFRPGSRHPPILRREPGTSGRIPHPSLALASRCGTTASGNRCPTTPGRSSPIPRPIIERPFELPLGVLEVNTRIQIPEWPEPRLVEAIHVAWAGRIDLDRQHQQSQPGGRSQNDQHRGRHLHSSYMLSHQTIGYVWAAQQIWPQPRHHRLLPQRHLPSSTAARHHQPAWPGAPRRHAHPRFLPRLFRV